MKSDFASNGRGLRRAGKRTMQGVTLVEMMVTMCIFSFVVIGLIYAQMFGLRYDELVSSKLGSSEMSRRSFDLLTSDIRSAKVWSIGTGGQSSFVACGNGTNQVGNAIQLCYTTDTNSYVRYFFDSARLRLCRMTNGMATNACIANNLTNTMTFHAEKYDGTMASDLQYKYIIVTTMEFAQYQYPMTRVGPNYYYNYYRMQFRVASHCPN